MTEINKGGRPSNDEVKIKTSKIVESLAELGCTIAEVAQIIGGNKRYLWRDHREVWERGHGHLVKKLRGAQIDKALVEKNAQMLIHLGKHYLAQTDHLAIDRNEEEEAIDEMDTADLITLVTKHKDD